MPKEEEKEYLKILGVDKYSSENEFEIKRAYKRLALQFHPDKNQQNDFSARKQFDEVSKAFEFLTLEYRNDSYRPDYDQVFFDFLRDIFDWKEDAEGSSTSNFLMYFCGSKQHPCSSDMDFDSRYQDTEEEEDIDGESDLDSILEIIKNRKKKGKHVPEEFKEENLLDMKTKLNQHKEDMKRDASKKQSSKKGKTPVPVAKPKPKSKKQLQAEQRRREKEMEKIAMELEEKRKEEEEKEKQRKQMEVEKQKRLEEERIKAQNEERKRREKEQKEREKQQKLEQEKEEKRRRQQEEEKKRKEEEEKRRKAEKEKADKEKAAKKAAQQAAKEKEEKEKAANKNQNMKRQQQQQRTDQQQYPREIPPRFQKKMKQQQQQQQQQSQYQAPPQQTQQQQSLPQQTKVQQKPAPTVGKKKDPNRFGAKEFADIIEPIDDSGWSQSAPGKGSGWGNSLETWDDTEKWGSEDRQWGDKEGTWDKLVVDGGDKDTWPAVGSKGAIGDKLKTSSSEAGSEKGQYSADSSPKTSVSSMSAALKSDNSSLAQGNVIANVDKKSLPSSNWPAGYPVPSENWDVIDESIDQAIDAADAATAKDSVGLATGWGGVAKGGLGGLIGNSSNWESGLKDSSSSVHSQESGKCELANSSGVSEAPSWSKTPGKGFKTKLPTTSAVGTSSITTSWGGTPAETNTKWTEPNLSSDGVKNSKSSKPPLLDSNSVAKSGAESKSEQSVMPNSGSKLSASGWGDVPTSNPSNWGNSADITGAACWDNAMSKPDSSELKAASNSKVSQWLESAGMSLADLDWGQEGMEHEEGSEGSLDGWTTASKRNRAPKPANDSNAWMNRSLKQLLDMGFKQEDAEKALKANHMNIESAIGDLLAMNISENLEQTVPVPGGKLQEPDPAEAARIQQQQQQSQSKLNRKQRRKLQQQQQAEQQTLVSKTDPKQGQTDLVVSKSLTQTSETLSKPNSEQQNKTSETQFTSKTDEGQQDSKTQPVAPTTKGDKPPLSGTGVAKPTNGQAPLPGNGKRTGPPLIPPAPGPAVQGPLRPPLAHPLLHHPLVQQFHLQQLRMAQGGLLQPPCTPQQFAMLQQIAQLQLVQQRLAAQSVAQQHMGQKQQVVPQQQLYQQQQQIALMIAQMQQHVLQQQPGLAGRHPALPFTALQQQQQQSLIQQQQQQQPSPTAQQKGNKPATNDKPTSEAAQTKTTDTVKTQPNEPSSVSPVTSEEQTKQPSPVPQSRLTQWKQPLLQDPTTVAQPPVTSSTPTPVDSKPQTVSTPSQSASSVLPSVVSAPSISTSDVSDPSAPNSNNVSPRTRIPDPVSSRWGVDAGPKLSADPPEFKPGVPWRPAPRNDKRDDGRDVVSPGTVEMQSRSSSSSSESPSESWSNSGNPPVSVPSNVPSVNTGKAADDVVSSAVTSGFSGLSINNSTFETSQIDFGLSSTPWQPTDSKAPLPPPQGTNKPGSSAASLLRPPPGLGTETSLPESPLFDDEPPAWLKSLIDGSNLGGEKTQPEFQFSRFGFANSPAPWSPRDASSQPFSPLTPNPQPWAAVGGPAPTLSSSGPVVAMPTSENVRSGSVSAAEPSNLQNSGIIWSTNQPIPSAEEKLPGSLPGASTVSAVPAASGVAPSRNAVNSMSTWLVLRNLSPRMDPKALRPLCERHGPLLTFQLNLRHGNSLIRYGSMEEAAKARTALNGLMLSGTQVVADFATDSDIGSFFEQTMDWSANPFPSNTYGNQWSFQNVLGSAATNDSIQSGAKAPIAKTQPPVTCTEQPAPKVNNPAPGMQWGAAVGALPSQGLAPGEQSKVNAPTTQWGAGSQGSEQPGAKPNTAAPSVPWGSAPGAAPTPSYLWGSGPTQPPVLGGNFSQVPSMWSFPAGVPRDVEPQSGSGDGLVSPSMTTFLPPGLLNGGGDPV